MTGTIFVIANGLPAESLDVGRRVLWFLLVALLSHAMPADTPPAWRPTPATARSAAPTMSGA